MTANVLEHRRAKAFAEALEAHRTGQPANRAVLGQLLDTAEALTAIAAPAMDAEVRTVQRATLLAAFEQHAAGGLAALSPAGSADGATAPSGSANGAAGDGGSRSPAWSPGSPWAASRAFRPRARAHCPGTRCTA